MPPLYHLLLSCTSGLLDWVSCDGWTQGPGRLVDPGWRSPHPHGPARSLFAHTTAGLAGAFQKHQRVLHKLQRAVTPRTNALSFEATANRAGRNRRQPYRGRYVTSQCRLTPTEFLMASKNQRLSLRYGVLFRNICLGI